MVYNDHLSLYKRLGYRKGIFRISSTSYFHMLKEEKTQGTEVSLGDSEERHRFFLLF